MKPEDICAHLGDDYPDHLGAISPPIYQTSLFTRKTGSTGYSYTRSGNPTTEVAEKKIAALEYGSGKAQEDGIVARCFSSGMAAITSAIMHHVKAGSHVIAPNNIYAPARGFLNDYLSRFNVSVTFVEGPGLTEIEDAIRDETDLVYLESPVSNVFTLQDLEAVSALACEHGIATVIDNSWATPIFQHPLLLGVDMVVHSASKYLGGHSDIVAGVVIGKGESMHRITHRERGMFGASMDPHQSWLLARSLRTLPLRMERHKQSALSVARFLEDHPKVRRVFYPGLPSHPQFDLGRRQMSGYSGLMSFIPDADNDEIRRMIYSLEMFEIGPSWGGYESLITAPGTGMDDEKSKELGIPQGLVRLSVGLEDPETLKNDLGAALERMR